MGIDVLFYMLALGTIGCAFAALFMPQVVHGILFLIGAFFNASGLFLLLGAEFLAFVLIMVYVGAVALLFLFVIMTLDSKTSPILSVPFYKKPSVYVGVLLLMEMTVFLTVQGREATLTFSSLADGTNNIQANNIQALGEVLYTHYFFPFQLVGVILLTALVSAIALIGGAKNKSKQQDMKHQRDVSATRRLTLKNPPLGKGIV